MTNDGENWTLWAQRADPHFTTALARCVDHGIEADKAGFLGLMFYFGVICSCPTTSMCRDDILTFKATLDDALNVLAERAAGDTE